MVRPAGWRPPRAPRGVRGPLHPRRFAPRIPQPPNPAATGQAAPRRAARLSPMCPDRSVTHVPGCTPERGKHDMRLQPQQCRRHQSRRAGSGSSLWRGGHIDVRKRRVLQAAGESVQRVRWRIAFGTGAARGCGGRRLHGVHTLPIRGNHGTQQALEVDPKLAGGSLPMSGTGRIRLEPFLFSHAQLANRAYVPPLDVGAKLRCWTGVAGLDHVAMLLAAGLRSP